MTKRKLKRKKTMDAQKVKQATLFLADRIGNRQRMTPTTLFALIGDTIEHADPD
jgi:hypothetical protein